MAYTLGDLDLGCVLSENINGESEKIILPSSMGQDSSDTIAVQMGGAKLMFSVEGTFTGSEADVNNFVQKIVGWGEGNLTSPLSYNGKRFQNICVVIDGYSIDEKTYGKDVIHYSLRLIRVNCNYGVV